ncbi:integrator complex subunit 12-like [Ischnura elegans]|uniref:integrator complex subunit 12-like n=1 Tax=Ischnura elegans TaxID=197161 RepID=UPI001ED87AB8|nr:integrator complex subunit 12-like [Ischnura elegans]
MAAYELDPVFSLGLKLLHSKSRDSADQLRSLLEEVTKQKYGGSSRLLPTMKRMSEERFESSKSGAPELMAKSSATKTGVIIPPPAANVGLQSGAGTPVLPLTKVEDVGSASDSYSGSRVIGSRHGSDGSDSDDADDLALEILEEDLMCVVCRGMDVGARNRLVECVECHSLYHQECHRPPIQEAHASDPRRVWTCSACSKPQTLQPSTVPKAPPIRVGGGKPISIITSKKSEPKSQSPLSSVAMQQSPIKSGSSSNNSKSSFSSSSTKSSSSGGISKGSSSKSVDGTSSSKSSSLSSSSLTSSVASSAGSSGNSSSANSGSSKVLSSKIAHADKRIQIMKKKAAKMQEKRKLSK